MPWDPSLLCPSLSPDSAQPPPREPSGYLPQFCELACQPPSPLLNPLLAPGDNERVSWALGHFGVLGRLAWGFRNLTHLNQNFPSLQIQCSPLPPTPACLVGYQSHRPRAAGPHPALLAHSSPPPTPVPLGCQVERAGQVTGRATGRGRVRTPRQVALGRPALAPPPSCQEQAWGLCSALMWGQAAGEP